MRKVTTAATWLAVLLLAIGIIGAHANANNAARLRELRERWVTQINAENLDGLVGLYADGAVIMPSYVAPRLGRDAIRRWYRAQFAKIDAHYAYEATEITVDGAWASERWTVRMKLTSTGADSDTTESDPVQFVEDGVRVYRKVGGGSWKIDHEYWSGGHPAADYLTELPNSACTAPRC